MTERTRAVTEVEKSLDKLAEEINEEHRAFRRAFKATYRSALRAGDLLNDAKAEVSHGEWGAWVEENCEFSMRTAQVYMRMANNRAQVEGLIANADPDSLTITGIRRELAEAPLEWRAKSVSDTHLNAPATELVPQKAIPPTPREEDRPLGVIEQMEQSAEGRSALAEANHEFDQEGIYLKMSSRINDLYFMAKQMPPEEAAKREFAHHAADLARDAVKGRQYHRPIDIVDRAEQVRRWLGTFLQKLEEAEDRLYEQAEDDTEAREDPDDWFRENAEFYNPIPYKR